MVALLNNSILSQRLPAKTDEQVDNEVDQEHQVEHGKDDDKQPPVPILATLRDPGVEGVVGKEKVDSDDDSRQGAGDDLENKHVGEGKCSC